MVEDKGRNNLNPWWQVELLKTSASKHVTSDFLFGEEKSTYCFIYH